MAVELSPRVQRILRGPGPDLHAIPRVLVREAEALLAGAGIAKAAALDAFVERFTGAHYSVRGDPPDRLLGIFPGRGGRAASWRTATGAVVKCVESVGRPSHLIGLHVDGTVWCADGMAAEDVIPDASIQLASSIERWLEYDALLDELFDEPRGWHRLRVRAPGGTARRLAQRFELAPIAEVCDPVLEAWRRPELLVRARPTPRPEALATHAVEVFAVSLDEAREVAEEMVALAGIAPATFRWPPPEPEA